MDMIFISMQCVDMVLCRHKYFFSLLRGSIDNNNCTRWEYT